MKKALIVVISFITAGCSKITILDPKSTTGEEQAYLIWLSLAIMSVVILVVFVLFAYFVFKYRYTKGKEHTIPEQIIGNKKLEITYTIIPIILLIILAVPTVKITLDQSPSTKASEDDGIHIDVTARQFEWIFEYENGKKETDILVIPEGESIIFNLLSEDVIHSFWVPELAGKVDVFPNKELTYIINNPEQGTYNGKCAEFCGAQHGNMTFKVKVVSQDEYETYIKK